MAKRFQPEYTADDVLGLYQIRSEEGDEARLRGLATQFRALTRMERKPTIPKQYEAISRDVRTPFVRDAWHRITSSLCAKPPVIHITPKDDKRSDYRDAANVAERFDMAMIERFNKQLGKDIIYNLTAQLVRDGESVLKVVHRPDAWANFPERETDEETADEVKGRQEEYKRGIDLPIAWLPVDRLQCVYEGGEYGDLWVIEYGEYTRPYLRTRYNMVEQNNRLVDPKHSLAGRAYAEGLNPTGKGRSVKVEFFTSREWHVLIDGSEAPGWPKANPYAPYLPYFRAPAYDSESLLYSLLFLAPRLDELLTMKLNWAVLGAYPTPLLEPIPNSNAFPGLDGIGDPGVAVGTPGHPLTWSPGKLFQPPPGYKLSYLAPPPVGKDLNDLVVIFKSLIDIAGIPSIMRGIAGAGDSGYLANQLRAAAEMAYKLAALAGQRQLEKATEFSHWLIEHKVQQTVYVLGWDSINPKTGRPVEKASQAWLGLTHREGKATANIAKISMLGPLSFQYRPTLPTDEQARAMIALQLTNAENQLYDVRHALENYMQEEDPESILDAIWLEKAMRKPEIEGPLMEEALREAGMLPKPPEPNPAAGLVDQFGQPLQSGGPQAMPPGPGQIQGVPMENMPLPGMPGVPGVTMPLVQGTPPPPQGIPGAPGGRPAGMFPGLPGGPQQ